MNGEVNFMVGGEAGQGVQSAGQILARALARGGFHVFADQDYESRVRGGHNFFRVRAGNNESRAISEELDILVALDRASIDLHRPEMSANGVIIFNGDKIKDIEGNGDLLAVPLENLAQTSGGNKLMTNTVALGAALGLVDYDLQIVNKVVEDHFGTGDVGKANVAAVAEGYKYAGQHLKDKPGQSLKPVGKRKSMLLNGNEAIALGALAAGCKFMAAYPMTPSTSIMEYMAAQSEELGIVVVQPEDEISAINMIVGAAYAGVRAMTATSGGGFCLMVEGLGLAGMTETPVVIVDAQRPGPAIGLPTRTEQGDLEFAVYASHGEFPRVVLAPATVEDAFWLTIKAFNLAEKYQLPVILLTDQYLASSYATVEKFDLSKVTVDRGQLLYGKEPANPEQYKRHLITESGISPRGLPFETGALIVTDADEHDEEGHMIEDADTRTSMMLKRLKKLKGLRKEMGRPRIYGAAQSEMTLVGWGSTYGALKEAVDLANRDSIKVNLIHFSEIWPFPAEEAGDALKGAKKLCAVENNATAQMAHLIRAETGHQCTSRIVKFDGRPFSPAYIYRQIKQEVS